MQALSGGGTAWNSAGGLKSDLAPPG